MNSESKAVEGPIPQRVKMLEKNKGKQKLKKMIFTIKTKKKKDTEILISGLKLTNCW